MRSISEKKGLVSIITPCYNAENTLKYTIESVVNQSYTNWELLIVDDCSSDGTSRIVEVYKHEDNRIKYFKTNKASGSPSEPRNIGLQNACGEFIAFLDSDDIWLPRKLEEQIAFMAERDCAFVYSNYEKITWDGKRNNRVLTMREISTYCNTLRCCEIPCLTVLLKAEIVKERYFEKIGKEDYVFWLSILRDGYIAYNTGKVHALYRESFQSRSCNKIKMIKEQWYVLRKVERQPFIVAFYSMLFYSLRGWLKYIK